MNKYVVQNGDGDEHDFATLPEAIACAEEELSVYREDAKSDGEWNDCAQHVRILEVIAIAHGITSKDDEGIEYVDYSIVEVVQR